MKKFLLLFLVVFPLTQCDDDDSSRTCSTYATVRNLTGFDGCDYVFELEDGSRVIPLRLIRCGTVSPEGRTSETETDPLLAFEFVAGKRVRISYEVTDNMSACMVGPVVRITCLTEISAPTED